MIETCEGDDIGSVSLLQIIISTCLSVAVHDSHHGEHDIASLIAWWAGILILCRERLLEVHLAIGACSAVSDAV